MTKVGDKRTEGKRLTKAQLRALAAISHQGRASPYSAKVSIATFKALERKRLIVVETTLGSIAFPHNAEATLTPAGRAALKDPNQ